jgi:hypothetical protein
MGRASAPEVSPSLVKLARVGRTLFYVAFDLAFDPSGPTAASATVEAPRKSASLVPIEWTTY